jgi:hypothetical protein
LLLDVRLYGFSGSGIQGIHCFCLRRKHIATRGRKTIRV